MAWIISFALFLGLSLAALKKRRRRWAATDAERAPRPQELDVPGDGRRSKYRVTQLQSGLDQDPED